MEYALSGFSGGSAQAGSPCIVHRGYEPAGETGFWGLARDKTPVRDGPCLDFRHPAPVASEGPRTLPSGFPDRNGLHFQSPLPESRGPAASGHAPASNQRKLGEAELLPSAAESSSWYGISGHRSNSSADSRQKFIPYSHGNSLPLTYAQAVALPRSQLAPGKCSVDEQARGGFYVPYTAPSSSPLLARLLLCILTSRADASRISALLRLEAHAASLLHDTRRLHMTLTVLDAVLCNAVPIAVVALNSPHFRRPSTRSPVVRTASAAGVLRTAASRSSCATGIRLDTSEGTHRHQPYTLRHSGGRSRRSSPPSGNFTHHDVASERIRRECPDHDGQGSAPSGACKNDFLVAGAAHAWDTDHLVDCSYGGDFDRNSLRPETAARAVCPTGGTRQEQSSCISTSRFSSRSVSVPRDSDSIVAGDRGTVTTAEEGQDPFPGRTLSMPEDEGGVSGFPGRRGLSAMVQIDFSNDAFFSGNVSSPYASGTVVEQVTAKEGRVFHSRHVDRVVQAIVQPSSAASAGSPLEGGLDKATGGVMEDPSRFVEASPNSCTSRSGKAAAHTSRGARTDGESAVSSTEANPENTANLPVRGSAGPGQYAADLCNADRAAASNSCVSSFSRGYGLMKGDAVSPELYGDAEHSSFARMRCLQSTGVSKESIRGGNVSLLVGECGTRRHLRTGVPSHSGQPSCDPGATSAESWSCRVRGGGFLRAGNGGGLRSAPPRPSLVVGQPFSAVSRLVCMQVYTSVCVCLDLVLIAPHWVERLVGLLHAVIRRSSVHEDAVFRSFACDCLQELEKSCPGLLSAFLGPNWFAGPGWVSTLSTRSLERPKEFYPGTVKGSRKSSRFRSLLLSSSISPQRDGCFYLVELLQTERQHVAEAYAGLLLTAARHTTEMLVQEAVSTSVSVGSTRLNVPTETKVTDFEREERRRWDSLGAKEAKGCGQLAGNQCWRATPECLPAQSSGEPRVYCHHRGASPQRETGEVKGTEPKSRGAWDRPVVKNAGSEERSQSGAFRRRKASLMERVCRGGFKIPSVGISVVPLLPLEYSSFETRLGGSASVHLRALSSFSGPQGGLHPSPFLFSSQLAQFPPPRLPRQFVSSLARALAVVLDGFWWFGEWTQLQIAHSLIFFSRLLGLPPSVTVDPLLPLLYSDRPPLVHAYLRLVVVYPHTLNHVVVRLVEQKVKDLSTNQSLKPYFRILALRWLLALFDLPLFAPVFFRSPPSFLYPAEGDSTEVKEQLLQLLLVFYRRRSLYLAATAIELKRVGQNFPSRVAVVEGRALRDAWRTHATERTHSGEAAAGAVDLECFQTYRDETPATAARKAFAVGTVRPRGGSDRGVRVSSLAPRRRSEERRSFSHGDKGEGNIVPRACLPGNLLDVCEVLQEFRYSPEPVGAHAVVYRFLLRLLLFPCQSLRDKVHAFICEQLRTHSALLMASTLALLHHLSKCRTGIHDRLLSFGGSSSLLSTSASPPSSPCSAVGSLPPHSVTARFRQGSSFPPPRQAPCLLPYLGYGPPPVLDGALLWWTALIDSQSAAAFSLLLSLGEFVKRLEPPSHIPQFFPLLLRLAVEPVVPASIVLQALHRLVRASASGGAAAAAGVADVMQDQWETGMKVLAICKELLLKHSQAGLYEGMSQLLLQLSEITACIDVRDNAVLLLKVITHTGQMPLKALLSRAEHQMIPLMHRHLTCVSPPTYRIDGFLPFLTFEKSCRERREVCGLLDHQAAFFLSTVFHTPGEEEAIADVFVFLRSDTCQRSSYSSLLQHCGGSGAGKYDTMSLHKGLQSISPGYHWTGHERDKNQAGQQMVQARREKCERLLQAFSRFYAVCYESDRKTIAMLNAVHASRTGSTSKSSYPGNLSPPGSHNVGQTSGKGIHSSDVKQLLRTALPLSVIAGPAEESQGKRHHSGAYSGPSADVPELALENAGPQRGRSSSPVRCEHATTVTMAVGSPRHSFCPSAEACADILACYRAFVAATPFYIRMPFYIRFTKRNNMGMLWSQTANRPYYGSSESSSSSDQGLVNGRVRVAARPSPKPFMPQYRARRAQKMHFGKSPVVPAADGSEHDVLPAASNQSSWSLLPSGRSMSFATACLTSPVSRVLEGAESAGGLERGVEEGGPAMKDGCRDGRGVLTSNNNFLSLSELYGIELNFSQVQDYMPMRSVRLPFLQDWAALPRIRRRSNEAGCENDVEAEKEAHAFPFMYKIVLKLQPKEPVPASIAVDVRFNDAAGGLFFGQLETFSISFQDLFLPVCAPRELWRPLFQHLWADPTLARSVKILEFDSSTVTRMIEMTLKPFLIDEPTSDDSEDFDFEQDEFFLKPEINVRSTRSSSSGNRRSPSRTTSDSSGSHPSRFRKKKQRRHGPGQAHQPGQRDSTKNHRHRKPTTSRSRYEKADSEISSQESQSVLSDCSARRFPRRRRDSSDEPPRHLVDSSSEHDSTDLTEDGYTETGQLSDSSYFVDEYFSRTGETSPDGNDGKHGQNRRDQRTQTRVARVVIFIPPRYHLLLKFSVSRITSVVRIATDRYQLLGYMDNFFAASSRLVEVKRLT